MRLLVNVIAIFGLAAGLTSMVQLYMLRMDASDAQGFATVAVPFWALAGAALAIIFGFIGRIMDRRVPRPAAKISNYAIAFGALIGGATLAIPFVFA